MSLPPGDEYRARLASRQASCRALATRDRLLSRARLLTFFTEVALVALWWRGTAAGGWLAPPVILFAVLLHRHARVIRALDQTQRSVSFYELGFGRIEDRWRFSPGPETLRSCSLR